MTDASWEARFSQRYREPPWAVEQQLVIDVVSSAILFIFYPLHSCLLFSLSGQKHTVGGLLVSVVLVHTAVRTGLTPNMRSNILSMQVDFSESISALR